MKCSKYGLTLCSRCVVRNQQEKEEWRYFCTPKQMEKNLIYSTIITRCPKCDYPIKWFGYDTPPRYCSKCRYEYWK